MPKIHQDDVIDLTLRLRDDKEAIQKRFDAGMTGTEFAAELKVPVSALRRVLEKIGIRHTNRTPNNNLAARVRALEIVVTRLAEGLNEDWREIKGYPRTP